MKTLTQLLFGILISFPALAHSSSLEITKNSDSIQSQGNQYYRYDFGLVRVNWSQYADFSLRNTGSTPLPIRGIFISGSRFWAWSNCPAVLSVGQRCWTRVEFRPWWEGSYYGRLRFAFPDGNIFIDLYGWGTRY